MSGSASAPRPAPRHWWMALSLLLLFAGGVRQYFVATAGAQPPLHGDAVEYFHYTRNLLEHGVFSRQRSGDAPRPDAYRTPAYPLLLAALPDFGTPAWLITVFHLQCWIGALGCLLLAAWTRPWLGAPLALTAGTLLALWPHHIAASGMLLVEVCFGTALLAAACMLSRALAHDRAGTAAAAGVCCAGAALFNPVALPLAPLIALGLLARRRRRLALALFCGWFLLAAPWELRSFTLDPAQRGSVRARINLVQGSWPSYHIAYASRNAHPEPARILREIGREERLMQDDAWAGLQAMGSRMAERPAFFLAWYALEKPRLLWDWDIRIGAGDVYVHPVSNSALERHWLLATVKRTLRSINPALGPLALLCALVWGVFALRTRSVPAAAALAAFLFLYFTLLHVVLQAEPRYATAYRGFEIALLLGSVPLVRTWRAARRAVRARAQDEKPPSHAVHTIAVTRHVTL